MKKESLLIILNQYKKEHITEDETVQLIEDLYNNQNWIYSPHVTPITPLYDMKTNCTQ